MKVLQFPLTKITICFIAGIIAAFYIKLPILVAFSFCGSVFIGFGIAFYLSNWDLLQKAWFGISIYLLSFCAGITAFSVNLGFNDQNNYIHFAGISENDDTVEVILRERLKSSAYNIRYIGSVISLNGRRTSGKILINLDKNDFAKTFVVGTHLKIHESIYKHKTPRNPQQFDYGKYLSNKSVLSQIYADGKTAKVGTIITKDAYYYADVLRNRILINLHHSGFSKTELPVIAALILGQQQDISPEILHDYQFAGAIHILSVSGLHVGFILLFINFALKFLPKTKRNSWLKLLIIISSLWGFAVLAGLSPSVIRSVTMFSFVAIGMHLNRQTNVFHTLVVSVFLILLFEPSFLFDVGFQLSYTALFFILWLQPIFSKFWQPESKVVRYFWEILTVSFAAQIGTLPLSIYYFHQFPGLFFITNLVIIPFLSVIMALGVFVMIIAVFGNVPLIFVKALEWNIIILNKIIAWIASFEQFIFQNIPLNQYFLFAAYLMIVSIFVWLEKPNFKKLSLAFTTLIIFQLSYFTTHLSSRNEREWIVFNERKTTLIAERNNAEIIIYGERNFKNNQMLQTYAVANFSKIIKTVKVPNAAYFNEKKILIVDSTAVYPFQSVPDILILRQSPRVNLERLLQNCHPKIIVADASNYKSYIKLWKETCRKRKIPFHATAETGFFKI